METCDATELLEQACANGFKQLAESSPALAQAVLNQLLCNLINTP
jgi:hypothetical protein